MILTELTIDHILNSNNKCNGPKRLSYNKISSTYDYRDEKYYL